MKREKFNYLGYFL